MRQFQIVILVAMLAAFALPSPARAAADCEPTQEIQWREMDGGAFTILYPEEYELLGRVLAASLERDAMEREYARFEALFESSLSLPLSLRVYPNAEAYTCLNAQTEALPAGTMHTHAGVREISLIGDRVAENFPAWAQNDVNLLRYELSSLFTRQIAGDHAPSGLVEALGYYVQDPRATIGTMRLNWNDWREPTYDWRALWDERPGSDLSRKLQATSTVAYLVDTYGWEALVKFIHSLPASQSFPQALSRAYGVDFSTLEAGWREYYPRYFQGRWQSHVIYNFDLAPYQQLIREEKYNEADRKLIEALSFLEMTQQPEKGYQAMLLLATARKGLEAETFFAQSQQAFSAGRYEEALALIDQAERRYAETSNRFYHLDALAAHREQIKQVIALHGELDQVQGRVTDEWNTFALANHLIDLGRRLSQLGDTQGHARVLEMARAVEDRQREQYSWVAAAVFAVVLALLAVIVRLLWRRPPPEAQL